jgi:hypothetical protein
VHRQLGLCGPVHVIMHASGGLSGWSRPWSERSRGPRQITRFIEHGRFAWLKAEMGFADSRQAFWRASASTVDDSVAVGPPEINRVQSTVGAGLQLVQPQALAIYRIQYSSTRARIWFGTRGSEVQILSPRPFVFNLLKFRWSAPPIPPTHFELAEHLYVEQIDDVSSKLLLDCGDSPRLQLIPSVHNSYRTTPRARVSAKRLEAGMPYWRNSASTPRACR